VLAITYTLTMDDMMEVWRHLVLTNVAHRRARWIRTVLPSAMAVLLVSAAVAFRTEVSGSLIAVAILVALLGIVTWHIWSSYPDKALARIVSHWEKYAPPNSLGEVALTLGEGGVMSKTPQAQATYQWSAFTDYSDLQNCVVLWLGRFNLLLIPKRSLPEGAINELLRIVSGQLRAA